MMGRYEILIPLLDNRGRDFDQGEYEAFEGICFEQFGGFSTIAGLVRGVWRDPATMKIYDEKMSLYYVYSDDDATVLAVARAAAKIFRQVAISVTLPGSIAKIVYADAIQGEEAA
jgi:hypothetical protein